MADTTAVEYAPVTSSRDLVDRLQVTWMAMATAPDTMTIASLDANCTPLHFVGKAIKKVLAYILAVDYGITAPAAQRGHIDSIWNETISSGITVTAAIAGWYEDLTQ